MLEDMYKLTLYSWEELAELNNLERSVRTAKQLTAENCRKSDKRSESRDIKTL